MDLSTRYLGLDLPHPFVVGASPLSADLDGARRLEDQGAAAIVLFSLFEERSGRGWQRLPPRGRSWPWSAPPVAGSDSSLGPEEYLDHLARLKRALGVPVIASLNGSTPGGWLRYAQLMEQAGADALELNVYELAADPYASGLGVEDRLVEMVRTVSDQVRLPLAVKLTPFFSSLAHLARRLEENGAAGLVVFNRFYQADIDAEARSLRRVVRPSDSSELLLRLRWLAILSAQRRLSLAATGGVHTTLDAVKAVMAGAHALQLVSSLLVHGPEHLAVLRRDLADWLERQGVPSLAELRGAMDLRHCPDPAAFERGSYLEVLQSW